MTATPYVRLRPGAATWREVDGEIVLLDGSTSMFLRGNPTASLLWKGITEGATRSELVEALVAAFDVDAVTAGDAVDGFVEECRHRQLVV